VQILNSPAAVSFKQRLQATTSSHWTEHPYREGACSRNKSEDLPCNPIIIAFEEKALSLKNRTTILRPNHFIPTDSKKVKGK
jgi:hypothetical protein